jgi:large subunit ribosomal protein L35
VPKLKTNKTAAKRFEATSTGKILRGHVGMNHKKTKKGESRKRRLEAKSTVNNGEARQIRRMIPGI